MTRYTLAQPITMHGIGVHSGTKSSLTCLPQESGAGITWSCQGEPGLFRVGSGEPLVAPHATVIPIGKNILSTVEHVMAALYAAGVTDVALVVEGGEVPILDGSALPFYTELVEKRIVASGERCIIAPREKLVFTEEGRDGFIEVHPHKHEGLVLQYESTVAGMCGRVEGVFVSPEWLSAEILPARTCGFVDQLPFLRKHGLAQGSSLGNTIALREDGSFVNTPRFHDEPFRHKILDLIGDMYLLGYPLVGKVVAKNVGHSLNRKLVAHRMKNSQCWQVLKAKNS